MLLLELGMKNTDFQELKNRSVEELHKKLGENRTQLQSLKFDLAAGKIKNVSMIHKTKKNIARILTIINMK